MQILNKYKKHFDQGFKEFVMNLDLLPSKVVKEVIFNGLLEDPVYVKWALENKIGFDYFLKLNKKDVLKVYHSLNNGSILFLRALKNHSEENNFIASTLPSLIYKQYQADRENEKITVALQEDARVKIMRIIFQLKDSGELEAFSWKMPPPEVLNGQAQLIDKFGNYKQFYDGNVLAITGQVVKGKRSGTWKNFYPNGAIHAEGLYSEGQKCEEWAFYYLNGNLKSCGEFRADLKHGPWKEYELNNDFKIINYENGKIKN